MGVSEKLQHYNFGVEYIFNHPKEPVKNHWSTKVLYSTNSDSPLIYELNNNF